LAAVVFAMLQPRIGIGGEVGVVTEDILGLFELLELDEKAFLAGVNVEGIVDFASFEIFCGGVTLAERRHSQVHEGGAEGGATEATGLGCSGLREQNGCGYDSHCFSVRYLRVSRLRDAPGWNRKTPSA
jgi:hypothetical protein